MPFQSKAQMKAAFSGGLGPEMQSKADEWAHETPNIKSLPEHKSPILKGGSNDMMSTNTKSFMQRGATEADATKAAIQTAKPYNNSHQRLGKFLHPRKDGKPHGSDKS